MILRPLAAALLTAGAIGVAPPVLAASDASDPEAVALARDVLQALGGEARWNALPGIRFTFFVAERDTVRSERHHAWDKHAGWHRVEGVDRAGDRYVIVHERNGDGGRAWVAGNAVQGDSLAKLLERGRALWVNDTYWFLMPYKMLDPGVILSVAEPAEIGGRMCDRIAMRFENVGMTPGDRYVVAIDRETQRVCHWEMRLQGREDQPREYTWEGWEPHGGLWFPTAHRDGERNIGMRGIETVQAFPPSTFTAP